MTPTDKLAIIERIAATKPHTRLSSVISHLAVLDKAEELKRSPDRRATFAEIIAGLRQLGRS